MISQLATLHGHTGIVYCLAIFDDGRLVANGGQDGTVHLWQAATGACLRILQPECCYERLDITGLTGITDAQRAARHALGGVENPVRTG
jgi:WD40 repeat protein